MILIHHSRKGSIDIDSLDSVRGSGDIIASCDVGIILFNKIKNAITIKVGKNRYDEEIEPFRAEFKKDSEGTSHWHYLGVLENNIKESDITEMVISILSKNTEMNQKNLISQIKSSGISVGEKKICRILDTLVTDGVILKTAGNRTEKRYRLKGETQNDKA